MDTLHAESAVEKIYGAHESEGGVCLADEKKVQGFECSSGKTGVSRFQNFVRNTIGGIVIAGGGLIAPFASVGADNIRAQEMEMAVTKVPDNTNKAPSHLTTQQKISLGYHVDKEELEKYRKENTIAWLKHIYEGGEEAWKKTLPKTPLAKSRKSYRAELYAFLNIDGYKRRFPDEEGYPEWTRDGISPDGNTEYYIFQLVSGDKRSSWFVMGICQELGDRWGKINPKGIFNSYEYNNLEEAIGEWSETMKRIKDRNKVASNQ